VFNHYNRVRANLSGLVPEAPPVSRLVANGELSESGTTPLAPHASRVFSSIPEGQGNFFEKSNVLMIGPTGSGKTLLARTLAKVLDVPFSVSDATSFTQAGYVGEDVEACIQRLLQAAQWDVHRASTGIVYIDEVDKIARRGVGFAIEGSRDVGGEGVQQALLRMMEGGVITIHTKGSGNDGSSDGSTRGRTARAVGPKHDTYQIDTTNILFILSGAFVGLENIVKERVIKGSIGFTASLSPSKNEGQFMPFFTPNGDNPPNILDLVEPADLIKFGFIPEFISRMPSITTLSLLSEDDLMRILTDVKGSLTSQYAALFGYSGVEIRFTTPALREIARRAIKRGGGARGLRGIMENLLLDAMYEVPGSSVRHVLINKAVAQGREHALYWSRGEAAKFWAKWADEEDAMKG